jgi:hypothetical protein
MHLFQFILAPPSFFADVVEMSTTYSTLHANAILPILNAGAQIVVWNKRKA